MTTLRDQYAVGLSALGYKRTDTASRKYWHYYKEGAGSCCHVWLGKAGALRYNSVNRIDGSIAASDAVKSKIIAKGAAARLPETRVATLQNALSFLHENGYRAEPSKLFPGCVRVLDPVHTCAKDGKLVVSYYRSVHLQYGRVFKFVIDRS